MTNATIILNEACNLFEQGLLKGTGKYIKMMYLDENGNEIEKEVELPEDIHTFAGWKALGYSVKKGRKGCQQVSDLEVCQVESLRSRGCKRRRRSIRTLHHEGCRVFLGIAGAAELTDALSSTGRRCLPLPVKYILKIG